MNKYKIRNFVRNLMFRPFGREYLETPDIIRINHGRVSGINLNPGESRDLGLGIVIRVDENGNFIHETKKQKHSEPK